MIRLRKTLFVLFSFLLFSVTVFAQCEDPEPPSDPDVPYEPPACDLPLDTWVYVLLFAAVAFYAYHLYKKQKALSI
ncbi:hypothetical protein [Mucilaginibacter sp. AK015]|uniref:hypothetical protein n=1 Tax=Mucilaginibacter sp. AK015 TaxID=2723072 RepID=UPI00161E0C8C|nr:hypothetical protein [Mucilaginibacter sp. AK015]MBB5395727.1 hypothetical protein [Mucilaginibacter sp. AK015]